MTTGSRYDNFQSHIIFKSGYISKKPKIFLKDTRKFVLILPCQEKKCVGKKKKCLRTINHVKKIGLINDFRNKYTC